MGPEPAGMGQPLAGVIFPLMKGDLEEHGA
jgi:hypothetical protein